MTKIENAFLYCCIFSTCRLVNYKTTIWYAYHKRFQMIYFFTILYQIAWHFIVQKQFKLCLKLLLVGWFKTCISELFTFAKNKQEKKNQTNFVGLRILKKVYTNLYIHICFLFCSKHIPDSIQELLPVCFTNKRTTSFTFVFFNKRSKMARLIG